jgi:BirA family biotin operon repressor/biotin-[acetyl-CoA-carboxylase] ligase
MTKEEILRHLRTKTFGRTIHTFETIDSTNSYARSIAAEAPEGTIVIAEHQTHGRGRLGRQWHASAGKNLTFSLIIRPTLPPSSAGLISLYASLGVAKAIESSTGVAARCKWPNDVLAGGRKLSGILSEVVISPPERFSVVIGIGVNVFETEFPPELRQSATSIALAGGKAGDRSSVLCAILEELEQSYHLLDGTKGAELIAAWSARSPMLGAAIEIAQNGGVVRGTATCLAEDGRLVVENAEGTHYIVAGDASLV